MGLCLGKIYVSNLPVRNVISTASIPTVATITVGEVLSSPPPAPEKSTSSISRRSLSRTNSRTNEQKDKELPSNVTVLPNNNNNSSFNAVGNVKKGAEIKEKQPSPSFIGLRRLNLSKIDKAQSGGRSQESPTHATIQTFSTHSTRSVRANSVEEDGLTGAEDTSIPQLLRSWTDTRLSKDKCKNYADVTVDVLLTNEKARAGFFQYLEATSQREKQKDEDSNPVRKLERQYSKARLTNDYRADCVLFWLEIQDLLKIPSGTFQLGLVQDIFDTYIKKSASRELPMLAASDVEELSNLLLDQCLDRVLLAYKVLAFDVLEILNQNFEKYLYSESKYGYAAATKEASMNVLERLSQSVAGANDRRSQLNQVINSPSECRLFREFLISKNSVESLLFIIDALAFEDLINTFEQEFTTSTTLESTASTADAANTANTAITNGVSDKSNSTSSSEKTAHYDYSVRQAQKIFNKYIRYGSKAEICLSGVIKEKFLSELAKYPLSADLFHEAVLVCSSELVGSLDIFYKSDAYKEYQSQRTLRGVSSLYSTSREASLSSVNRIQTLPSGMGSESGNCVQLPDSLPSAQEIINGVGASFFRDFLKEHGMDATLLFYREVAQFQLLPHGQKHYIQGKSRKIFDRFVRRGAKMEIELPADIRKDILYKLAEPSEQTFNEAQKYVLTLWEKQYFDLFMDHPLYTSMIQAMSKAKAEEKDTKKTGSSSSTTGGGGGGGAEEDHDQIVIGNGKDPHFIDLTKISLKNFLEIEYLRRFFRLFLEKEQCTSELHFYLDVQSFQQLPTSDYLTRQAKKIYNRFCDPKSKEYVSISNEVAREIEKSMQDPTPAMFKQGQEEVLVFFTFTLYPKFQQSHIYNSIRITHPEFERAKNPQNEAMYNLFGSKSSTRNIHEKKTLVHQKSTSSNMGLRKSFFFSDHKTPSNLPENTQDGPGNTTGSTSGTSGYSPRSGGTDSSRGTNARHSILGLLSTPELTEDDVNVVMILEHPDTRSLFLFFAEEIFCTESIFFWLDCNEYKDIPHRNYLKLRAQKIYRKYIAQSAKLQVNLEGTIVKDIVAQLDKPKRNTFMAAQMSIMRMLEKDTLAKFRKTKHFPVCFKTLKDAGVRPNHRRGSVSMRNLPIARKLSSLGLGSATNKVST